MKELVVATRNFGKLVEIELLLRGTVERVFSLREFPCYPEVVEDGATFAENALKKARVAASITGKPAVADDSGLVIDALNGSPGVHSARFAREGASDAENNAKLLELLKGVPHEARSCAFHCVIALCLSGGECQTFNGEVKGIILDQPRGSGGFGYDPLFLIPRYDQTMSELSLDVKNEISHRGQAFGRLKEYLRKV